MRIVDGRISTLEYDYERLIDGFYGYAARELEDTGFLVKKEMTNLALSVIGGFGYKVKRLPDSLQSKINGDCRGTLIRYADDSCHSALFIHELAHGLLKHDGNSYRNEFEAETASYLFHRFYDVDTLSETVFYLTWWPKHRPTLEKLIAPAGPSKLAIFAVVEEMLNMAERMKA